MGFRPCKGKKQTCNSNGELEEYQKLKFEADKRLNSSHFNRNKQPNFGQNCPITKSGTSPRFRRIS